MDCCLHYLHRAIQQCLGYFLPAIKVTSLSLINFSLLLQSKIYWKLMFSNIDEYSLRENYALQWDRTTINTLPRLHTPRQQSNIYMVTYSKQHVLNTLKISRQAKSWRILRPSRSGRKIKWVQCAKYVGIKQLNTLDSITANNGQKFNLVYE